MPKEEQIPIEPKHTHNEDRENNKKNEMLQRIGKMGGVSMLQNQSSAFAAPHHPHYSDDDSINNEYIQNMVSQRSVRTKQKKTFSFFLIDF